MTNVNHYRMSAAVLAAMLVACLLVAVGLTREALAASGDLDSTFDGDGKLTTDFGGTEEARDLAFQQDGKIVVAGNIQGGTATLTDFSLARYNPDGSLDTSFDGDGELITDFGGGNEFLRTVTVQRDGKIMAAGETSSSTSPIALAIARYNPDGSLDTSFDGDGKLTAGFFGDQIYDVAFQQDGKVVVAGNAFNLATGGSDFALARYNPDGSLDTTFDGDGKLTTDFGETSRDYAYALAMQQDGKIVAAGAAAPDPDQLSSDFGVARYNPDGSLDTSFSADGKVATDFYGSNDGATDLAVGQDGKMVVVGNAIDLAAGGNSDFGVARYNPDGSLDTSFGGDGRITTDFGCANGCNDRANALGLQSDGKIVAAGDTNHPSYDFALARYSSENSVSSACTFGEILPPVNDVSGATDGGMSAYKYGSRGVIPVKFQVACNDDPINTQAEADAHPMTLTLTRLGSTPDQDALVESTETGSANTGNLFRFDDAADQYVYNVAVKGLARGTYKITISEANGGGSHDEWFSIK